MQKEDISRLPEKFLRFVISPDPKKYVLLIFFFALIVRFFVASNVAPLADEMIHGTNAINIISSGVINAQNEAPLWLYLTDLSYKIFGVHAFSARMISILFGSLTVFVVYLLGSSLFNKRIGIISSVLFGLSSYYARYALMEMDQAMMFFVLFGFYVLERELNNTGKLSLYSFLIFGLALLIKPITIPFIVSAGLIYISVLYVRRKEDISKIIKNNHKRFIYAALILVLFASPILAYNFILYSQKGITDVIFSRFLGINQEIYSGLQGYNKVFVLSEVWTIGIPTLFKAYITMDPIILILGLLGTGLIFSTAKYSSGRILVWFHFISLIFLLGTSVLETHLSVFVPLLCISSAVLIASFIDSFVDEKNRVRVTVYLIIAIALVNLFIMSPQLTSKSAFSQLREVAIDKFSDADIVVADGRIYRGRIAWTFNDKAYIESPMFAELMGLNNNLTGKRIPAKLYFIECIQDDCGWGTIKDQPEFNTSVEQMVSFVKQNFQEEQVLYGGGGYDEPTGKPYFRIYSANIMVDPRLYPPIYSTHDWFYYPVRWAKSNWYDKYEPSGLAQLTLQTIGKIMLWLSVVLALIIPILVIKKYSEN